MDLYSSNLCCSKINCISNLLKEKKSLDWKFCKNSEIFHSQSVLSCLKLYKLYKISWEVFPLPVFSREVCSVLGWSSRTRRRQWHPTPVLLPGKSHGWRSLVGCSPWGRRGSDTTERLHFCFSLSCIGEWNGNPLQCSCLENPRDGGAWWAAVYGVTQSRTQLKWLSSSSMFHSCCCMSQISTFLIIL